MAPVNLRWPGGAAKAAITETLKIRDFTLLALAARRHQVRSGRTRVHDPHATLLGIVRQSE
jgi:hypothetical protein